VSAPHRTPTRRLPRAAQRSPLVLWLGALGSLPAAAAERDQRVADLILEGDCDKAVGVAAENLAQRPDQAGALRDHGDALRCGGDDIQALGSYRKALALAPEDRSLQRIVKTLAATKGRLTLHVEGVDPSLPPPWLEVAAGDARFPSYRRAVDTWYFQDLPAGEPLVVELAGPAVVPARVDLGPLEANRDRELVISMEQGRPAEVTLEPWTAALRVEQVEGGFRVPLKPGRVQVTPGLVHLAITTERGTITERFEARLGENLPIDVDTLIPGAVSLVGLPAGTTVRWPTGPDQESARQWTEPTSRLDPDVGYPLLRPIVLEEVRSGPQRFTFEHPVLGATEAELIVVGGEVSNLRVDVGRFPQASALEDAYAEWRRQDALARSTPESNRRAMRRKALAFSGGAIAAVGAVRLGTAAHNRDEAFAQYHSRVDTLRYEEAAGDYADAAEAVGKTRVGGALLIGGATMSTVGVTLTVREARLTRARRATRPWEPDLALGDPTGGSAATASSPSATGAESTGTPPADPSRQR
jgi:hypothetical protein